MEIYLIRHGETEWNRLRRLQGQSDIPLNDAGISSAIKAAQNISALQIDIIMHSPLSRARQTAELIRAERSCPISSEPLLKEISFGIGEGLNLYEANEEQQELAEALKLFFRNPGQYVPVKGAEGIAELKERCSHFLSDVLCPLEKSYGNGRVLLVAHGAVIRATLDIIHGIPDSSFWEGPLAPNCGGSILSLRDGQFTELCSVDLTEPVQLP